MIEILTLLAVFCIALITSAFSIPAIVTISKTNHYYDRPDSRKAATTIVPTLGGMAILIAFITAVSLGLYGKEFMEFRYILSGLLILFFVGMMDDVMILSAGKKFCIQLISALILVYFAKIRFTSIHGFLGIKNISDTFSIILTLFVLIVITNSFNLIDGIDGLASGICMLTAGSLGTWFYFSAHLKYAIVATSLVGVLSGFFIYNVWGKKNKIFMGDSGSLILGFIMAVLIIKFCEFNIDQSNTYAISSSPAVALGLLIVPLFDTIRVFSIRIFNNCSPFTPDKNHIHHRLLYLGYSHLQTTTRIIIINALFIVINYLLMDLHVIELALLNLTLAGLLSMIPVYIMKFRGIEFKKNDPHQKVLVPSREVKKILVLLVAGKEHRVKKPSMRKRKKDNFLNVEVTSRRFIP